MHATARAEEPRRIPSASAPRPERDPRHGMLHLQHAAGNAAVASVVARSALPVQRAKDETAGKAPAAEADLAPFTFKNFQFVNLNHSGEKYRDKAVRLLALLDKHPSIQKYVGGRPCRITLQLRGMENPTPADITDKGGTVEINLASYYFEKYDMGYVAGMLAHEFGIHPMAAGVAGIGDEEEAFTGFPMLVPGLEGKNPPRTMSTDGAKEKEHIFGASPDRKRYQAYRDVALEMATALYEQVQEQEEGATEKDVTDLLDCFLMDVATIAVGNDDRKAAGKEPSNVATVYNRYKTLVRDGLAENNPIKPLFPANKGLLGVLGDFTTLAYRITNGNKGDSIQQPAKPREPASAST
ncbi:hypothetical protein [Streptomyces parvulus]|uniref:hypothetical protein n=1 Tax=Streptomyces parvulus TaxID=146923 RepID=UPI0037AC5021